MKNSALYHKTVDILVQSYFEDTLVHCNCFACAVGNIVAANCGIKIVEDAKQSPYKGFSPLVWEGYNKIEQTPTYYCYERAIPEQPNEVVKMIESTGYSLHELSMVESAFEDCRAAPYEDNYINLDKCMFNGLMAVIETLDIIHDNTDTSVTTTSKARFTKSQPSQI